MCRPISRSCQSRARWRQSPRRPSGAARPWLRARRWTVTEITPTPAVGAVSRGSWGRRPRSGRTGAADVGAHPAGPARSPVASLMPTMFGCASPARRPCRWTCPRRSAPARCRAASAARTASRPPRSAAQPLLGGPVVVGRDHQGAVGADVLGVARQLDGLVGRGRAGAGDDRTRPAATATHSSTTRLCSSWASVGRSPVVPTGTSRGCPRRWRSTRDWRGGLVDGAVAKRCDERHNGTVEHGRFTP